MSRCVVAILGEIDGCGMHEWGNFVKAFGRLLDEMVEGIKGKSEKMVYDIRKRDIIIIRIVENVEKAFEVEDIISCICLRNFANSGVR